LERGDTETAKKRIFDEGEKFKIVDGKIVRRTKKATMVRIT